MLAALAGGHALSERSRAEAEAQNRLDITAAAVTIHVDQIVGTVELAMENVDSAWARAGYDRLAPGTRRVVAARLGAAPAIVDVALLDSHGVLLFGGRTVRPDEGLLDLSWRDWFRRTVALPNRALVVSAPIETVGAGPTSGRRVLPITRAIRDLQGELRGVVVVGIDPGLLLSSAAALPGVERVRLELLVLENPLGNPIDAGANGPDLDGQPTLVASRAIDRSGGTLSVRLSLAHADVETSWIEHTLVPDAMLTATAVWLAGAGMLLFRAQRRRVLLLRANEAQLRTLCDAAHIGFFRLPGRDVAGAWGDAVRSITGAASFAGLQALLSPEDRAALDEAVQRAIPGSVPRSVLVRVVHPEHGPRRIRVQIVPTLADEPGAWGHVQDETAEVAEMESAAHQQRMDMLGSLTAGVAHDFNNLFCALSLTLESARGAPALDPLDQAQRLVDRGADLTAQLLAYARRQPLRSMSVSLDDLLQDTARLLRQTLGAQHSLHASIASDIGRANLDPALLQTVLVRLAMNARDSMPHGGTVALEARQVVVGMNESLDLGVPPGTFVRLCVADHGVGLTADRVAAAFEPFREPARLAVGGNGPVQAGTFSGLPMVYGFAIQAGGAVQLRSGVEDGTQVVLYLPLRDLPSEPAPAPRPPATPIDLPRMRVLLIEDDPDLRECTRALLEHQGATVTALGDGLTAVARLCGETSYDLLLSDVVLPGGISGFDIVDGARRHDPDLPALLMSGYAQPELELGRERPVGTALLQKPFNSSALVAAIRDALPAASRQSAA